MPFVGSRGATIAELAVPGARLDALADAVCWLARHRLLYIDMRPANVRVADDAIFLVDYDDMLCLASPPTSAEELLQLLRANEHGAAALAAMPPFAEALTRQWRSAPTPAAVGRPRRRAATTQRPRRPPQARAVRAALTAGLVCR